MKVVVAGATGLVGSSMVRYFEAQGFEVIGVSRKNLDLLDSTATREFFMDIRPSLVIDAAARVGGIGANNSLPVEFLQDNTLIQSNLMRACHEAMVEKFVFLGSSCIYPRDSKQPIKEEYLMTGPLEITNSAYAVAKISGIELVNSYRKEFGRRWISLMPTNLYGRGDNFDLNSSHVLPALIRRFIEAEALEKEEVVLWGSGSPLREFLHVDDLANAVHLCFKNYDSQIHLNIGSGNEISIKDLALLVAKISGFEGKIVWDKSKPDGTPRKVLDSTRMRELGWEPRISLEQGIRDTVQWYRTAQLNGTLRL
jgi:GDP-L-fucose synthase